MGLRPPPPGFFSNARASSQLPSRSWKARTFRRRLQDGRRDRAGEHMRELVAEQRAGRGARHPRVVGLGDLAHHRRIGRVTSSSSRNPPSFTTTLTRRPMVRQRSSTAARFAFLSARLRTGMRSKLRSSSLRSAPWAMRSGRWRSSRRPRRSIAPGWRMRASIGRGSRMVGRTRIRARMSRSTSTPGATSASLSPSAVRRNTQRSVTWSTARPALGAGCRRTSHAQRVISRLPSGPGPSRRQPQTRPHRLRAARTAQRHAPGLDGGASLHARPARGWVTATITFASIAGVLRAATPSKPTGKPAAVSPVSRVLGRTRPFHPQSTTRQRAEAAATS